SAKTVRVRATSASPMNCGATMPMSSPRMTSTTSSSIRLKPPALRPCLAAADFDESRNEWNISSPARRSALNQFVDVENGQQNGHDDQRHDYAHENHCKGLQQS